MELTKETVEAIQAAVAKKIDDHRAERQTLAESRAELAEQLAGIDVRIAALDGTIKRWNKGMAAATEALAELFPKPAE